MTRPTTVAILGAGLTGLAAAHRLRRRLGSTARIVVLDAAERPGGKLRTVELGGPVDVGAEAYIGTKQKAARLIAELGLEDRIVGPSGLSSLLYINGGLHAMPAGTLMGVPGSSAAVAELVSPETRTRIDAEADPEKAAPLHWVAGDDCNLGQLVAARFGQEVVDRIVSPLLGGVYSTLADDLGLRATIPDLAQALDDLVVLGEPVSLTAAVGRVLEQRTAARAAAAGRRAKAAGDPGAADMPKYKGIFRALDGGFDTLVEALIERSGAEMVYGSEVSEINAEPLSVPGVGEVDGIVLATPAPVTGKLLAPIAPDPADIIGGIDLASSAVVALRFGTDEGLPENSGILVAADAGLDAKAFTFSSRKWPHIAERGGGLVRASFGRYGDTTLVELDDGELVRRAIRDLEKATGFTAEPMETFVQRWYGGIPRYGVGHSELIGVADQMMEEVAARGIVAAGAWHRGPGLSACIEDAEDAVEQLLPAL